jgi:hypothetical protein
MLPSLQVPLVHYDIDSICHESDVPPFCFFISHTSKGLHAHGQYHTDLKPSTHKFKSHMY